MRCYGDTFECGFHSQYQDTSYINGMSAYTAFCSVSPSFVLFV
jgi:hypothetical protein